MSRRLYLGRLPPDARTDDVSKLFDGFGRIVDCRVMTGFGFVEFESSKDAEDAVQQFNGKQFMGANIVVEFAKESRPRRDVYEGDRGAPRSRRPPGIRLIVSGVSRDTSWQDLKDFGRDAGSVSFADIDRDVPGQGILEYLTREDANRAVRDLDGKDLRGRPVRVALDDSRGGPDNYRRDDRRDRDDRYSREDRYSDRDRYRDDRRDDRREYSRRDRSRERSPRRGDDRDRTHRSPPPHKRGTDEDKTGEDDRRERRRGGEDDERPRNGEGGWSR